MRAKKGEVSYSLRVLKTLQSPIARSGVAKSYAGIIGPFLQNAISGSFGLSIY
jgi:hypothetical protein